MIIPILPMPPIENILILEEWHNKQPQQGDHIRVSRGVYNHHGIYISQHEVIHFSSKNDDNILGTDNKVIKTSLTGFLRNGQVEVKIYNQDELNDLYPVPDIIHWARQSLGDDGYNLIFNNCEHFANWCTLGRFHSQQVNNVLGGTNMGLLSKVGGLLGSIFGGGSSSRSSSSTSYEPDKVRVAEIERDKALQLADRENTRIALMKDAQLELAEFNARMEAAIIEAKARGFHAMQQSLVSMTKELNALAQERMQLIENGSFDILQKVERLYGELETSIEQNDFMSSRLPSLLAIHSQFAEGSDARQTYGKAIDLQITQHFSFMNNQIQQLRERRTAVVNSVLTAKDKIHDHVNQLISGQMAKLETKPQTSLATHKTELLESKHK